MSLYIYALIDEKKNQVFYVGKTNDPDRRLGEHYRESRRGRGHNPDKESYIRDCLENDRPIEMLVVEEVSDEDHWPTYEQAWIAKFMMAGHPILNREIH